jgi:16S rRNA U516 pseudouridylate synthase RsuA-like enzyme
MDYSKDLGRKLAHTDNSVQKNYNAAFESDLDIDSMHKFTKHLFLSDLARHEHVRVNHTLIKTTFESFQ